MTHFLLTWLATAVALLITANLVPGFNVENLTAAAIAAVILGLVNAIVRPILFLLTLPLTVVTLGLFLFIINAITIWFAADLSPGFSIDGFLPALLGSIVLTLVSSVLNLLVGAVD
ncbi:phage holin family protein [Leptolyngbya sp. FACHB-261]|uniref:phage holin family protein n=1 Tax=Leptolyngbya sp. FACHB-261 TaxID=2692806 RepID=UPI0016829AAD|nr:phage holin family protein [Leptolyngbya sp. FACHB-261]MBD2102106.1 phage holin family protein [Leptolyngbya sp. FACHB-261]